MFSLGAGVVIALIFYLPFVNLEAAFFYIKTKGAAMMFGRNPYEGIELDFEDTNSVNHIDPMTGVDNYGMDHQSEIYNTIRTSTDPTKYYNAVDSASSKPVEVTEL